MKTTLTPLALALVLASGAVQAKDYADIRQNGDRNKSIVSQVTTLEDGRIEIKQPGNRNKAIVEQKFSQASTITEITQLKDENKAKVKQIRTENSKVTITQNIHNDVFVRQTGNNSKTEVKQGDENTAELYQGANNSFLHVDQDGAALSHVEFHQYGNNSDATLVQHGGTGDSSITGRQFDDGSHMAGVFQSSTYGTTAAVNQHGRQQKALVSQSNTGAGTKATVNQHGYNNDVTLYQRAGDNSTYDSTQKGRNNIIDVSNKPADTGFDGGQFGNDNTASFTQIGNRNVANLVQHGNDWAIARQYGNANIATISQ